MAWGNRLALPMVSANPHTWHTLPI